LSCFFLPSPRHLLGFFASLCGGEVCGRVPSPTLENLLAIGITTQASLELKGHNFLSLCLFLNVSHFDRLSTAKDLKMTLLLTLVLTCQNENL